MCIEPPAEMDLGFPTGRGADEPLRWSVTPAAKREATLSQMRPQARSAVLLRRRSPALSCQDGPRSRIPHGAGMARSLSGGSEGGDKWWEGSIISSFEHVR